MNNKSNLLQFLNNVLVFIALEVISIVLITNNGVIQKYKIMGWIRSSQAFFWNKEESFKYYFNLQEENERLLEENKSLRDVLVKYESLESYSDSLLLSTDPCYEYIPAAIIKRTTGRQRNFFILNKGTDNGIADGMGVATSKGVIGIVSAASRHYAYVTSFLNVDQSISVRISSSQNCGPLSWTGRNDKEAILRDIPIHKEIDIGDEVLTSGYSSIFPAGIPVGKITEVNSKNGLSLEISVELYEDFNSLRFVNIIKNLHQQEITDLEKYE